MSTRTPLPAWLILAGAAALLVAACAQAAPTAAPTSPPAPTAAPTVAPTAPPTLTPLAGDATRGGLLYDNWMTVVGAEAPAGDQPLWQTQTTNTRSGADTWRCKECHGWDYRGKDGAYGSGSHATGFAGVSGVAGSDANGILALLQGGANPDHDFSAVLDEQSLIDLALFLAEGQQDPSGLVGADKLATSTDLSTGEALFSEDCTQCHGPQGTAVNFGDEGGPEYVGTIAAGNPWEFLHKLRFGQPGVMMPAALDLGWSVEEQAAVLAYAQSLPTASPITEGGRLYDKWWDALGAEAPAGDQPLWQTQTTNTRSGADTWRCKECHGWDYRGKDGAYGSGSHQTGFTGIVDASGMSAEELAGWLTGQANPDHDFSAYFEEGQVEMLVAFVQQGPVDTSAYINADKTVNGDAAQGKSLYVSACARCHEDDGKAINFGDAAEPEYVGTIAVDNPLEFWHKASFGQPGTDMPAGLNFGWSPQDIADLLAYAQTLPSK